MRTQRGGVLVETAITVGLVLTLIVFSIQVGLLGFLQETADAASFVYSHGAVVGVNNAGGPGAVMNAVFPQIPVSAVSAAPSAAPTPNLGSVDYMYNGTAAEQSTASTNRHGGVSFTQPQSYNAIISKNNISNLQGFGIGVKSTNSEAYDRECGQHFNVAGSNAPCGDASDPANYEVNNLTNGENAPPYFMGFDYEYVCQAARPWATAYCPVATKVTAWNISANLYGHLQTFPTGSRQDDEANGQEFLNTGGAGGVSGSGNAGNEGTFLTAACIQRAAGWIASFLALYPSLGDVYRDFYAGPGPLPPESLFNYERGYYTTYNGIYYTEHNADGIYNYVRYQYSGPFDFQTDASISFMYKNGINDILTGYPTSSYSTPGKFQYLEHASCDYAQALPKYSYSY